MYSKAELQGTNNLGS